MASSAVSRPSSNLPASHKSEDMIGAGPEESAVGAKCDKPVEQDVEDEKEPEEEKAEASRKRDTFNKSEGQLLSPCEAESDASLSQHKLRKGWKFSSGIAFYFPLQ